MQLELLNNFLFRFAVCIIIFVQKLLNTVNKNLYVPDNNSRSFIICKTCNLKLYGFHREITSHFYPFFVALLGGSLVLYLSVNFFDKQKKQKSLKVPFANYIAFNIS